MSVSKRLRFEILRRDNHACRYCGASAPDAKLTVDHVLAITLGGSDDPSNLVAACVSCNSGKSSVPVGGQLVADISDQALRWATALNEAYDTMMTEWFDTTSALYEFETMWDRWTAGRGQTVPRSGDWETSVKHWLKLGLDINHLTSMIPVAMTRANVRTNSRWAYYCGIVWKTVRERQRRAEEIIAGEPPPLLLDEQDDNRADFLERLWRFKYDYPELPEDASVDERASRFREHCHTEESLRKLTEEFEAAVKAAGL